MDADAVQGEAVLVVNTGSRSGRESFELARRELEARGLPLAAAHAVEDPSDLPATLDEVVAQRPGMLVLAGGDGTQSSAADRLCGTGIVLGVLPTGTANDLARTLGLPTDLAAACGVVADGRTVEIDLGTLGEDRFFNVASMGLAVAVTNALDSGLKKRFGALAYPVAAVRAYRGHQLFSAHLDFPDGDHEPVDLEDLLQIAVANGRYYGGGAAAAPDAGIDDHTLDVYAVPQGTFRQRLSVLRHFVSGAFTEKDHVLSVKTRSVVVTTDRPLPITADGELGRETPQEFGIIPDALRVRVPKDSDVARPGRP